MTKTKKEVPLSLKIAALIICPIFVIGICSVAIVLTAKTLVPADVYSFEDEAEEPAETFADSPRISARIISLSGKATEANDGKLDRHTSVSINGLDGNMTGKQKNMLSYMIPSISSSLAGMYENGVRDYGGDLSDIRIAEICEADAGSEETNDKGTQVKSTLTLPAENNPLFDQYRKDDAAVREKAEKLSTDDIRIRILSAEPSSMELYAETDAAANRLTFLRVKRCYNVKAELSFAGTLSGLGTQEVSFEYEAKEENRLSYAGIFIKQDTLGVLPNDTQSLSVSANVAEDASSDDFVLSFSSSDESIATVDGNGIVSGIAESKTPVTVTVTLEYLGNTYTDSCLVSVGLACEGVSVSPAKHTVAVGETCEYKAKTDPKDATIKDIIWLSEDESIATVDENGVATGVAPGSTKIVAVTADGHFMSASDIFVEGGENR